MALVADVVRRSLVVVVGVVLVAACGGNRYAPPPPPEVTVARPVEQEVTTYMEFTGRTEAIETLEIRARVQGVLRSFNFDPGSIVKEGQLLFVIEPDLYEARVKQAQADVQGKEAQLKAAVTQLEIAQTIFARNAGSRTDLVQKQQARDLSDAALEAAKATLAEAQLDLSYTHIYAPFTGRIDRNLVDVGNLVGSGNATLLATLVRDDPIYVYFTASERDVLRYRELQRQHRTVAPEGEHNVAQMALATDTGFPWAGKVDYSGNKIDPDTGTIEIRAVFPNPERHLLAGLFARVRLPFTRERAIVVPEVAIAADQGGQYVLAVDPQGKVEQRRVRTGASIDGGLRIIQDGVKPGEQVVVNGLQRARPGEQVRVVEAQPAQNPTAGAAPGETKPAS